MIARRRIDKSVVYEFPRGGRKEGQLLVAAAALDVIVVMCIPDGRVGSSVLCMRLLLLLSPSYAEKPPLDVGRQGAGGAVGVPAKPRGSGELCKRKYNLQHTWQERGGLLELGWNERRERKEGATPASLLWEGRKIETLQHVDFSYIMKASNYQHTHSTRVGVQ